MSSFRPTISAAISYSTHAAPRLPNTTNPPWSLPAVPPDSQLALTDENSVPHSPWNFHRTTPNEYEEHRATAYWKSLLVQSTLYSLAHMFGKMLQGILAVDDGHLSIDLFSDPYPNLDEEAATANPSLPPCGQGCFDG